MSDNPFEQLAAQQLTAATKRKHQAAERRQAKSVVMSENEAPMKGTPAEQARDIRSAQMAGYRRHKARERDDLVHGDYGAEVAPLLATLKGLTIEFAPELVAAIEAATWIRGADENTKHVLLSIIADAIMRLRVRHGLTPFDDPIFDEPPDAFQLIRKIIMGV